MARVIKWIYGLDKILAAWLLFFLIVLVVSQVVMRTCFSVPLIGAEELARYLFICIAFVSLPFAARGQGHISMTELQRYLPDRFRRFIQLFIVLCAMATFGLVAVAAVITTFKNLGNVTPTLEIPFMLFFLPTILGFSAMTAEYTIRLIRMIQERRFGDEADDGQGPDSARHDSSTAGGI